MTDPMRRDPDMEVDEVVEPVSSVRRARTVPTTRYRAIHLVWFLAGVIDVVVGLRFLLKLFGASYQAPFVSLLYGISDPLVAPFRGIFPTTGQGVFIFEPPALVALLIYPLIAAGIVGVVRLMAGRPATTSSSW